MIILLFKNSCIVYFSSKWFSTHRPNLKFKKPSWLIMHSAAGQIFFYFKILCISKKCKYMKTMSHLMNINTCSQLDTQTYFKNKPHFYKSYYEQIQDITNDNKIFLFCEGPGCVIITAAKVCQFKLSSSLLSYMSQLHAMYQAVTLFPISQLTFHDITLQNLPNLVLI